MNSYVDYAGCTPPWLAGPGRPDHLIEADILPVLLEAGIEAWLDQDGDLHVEAADGTRLEIACYRDDEQSIRRRSGAFVGGVASCKPAAFMAALVALCKAEGIDLLGDEGE